MKQLKSWSSKQKYKKMVRRSARIQNYGIDEYGRGLWLIFYIDG